MDVYLRMASDEELTPVVTPSKQRFALYISLIIAGIFLIFTVFGWSNSLNREWSGTFFYIDYFLAGLFVNGGILFLLTTRIQNGYIVEKIFIIGAVITSCFMVGAIVAAAVRSEYRWAIHEFALQWPGTAVGLMLGYIRRQQKP